MEADEYLADIELGSIIFYGIFPGKVKGGPEGITITLPDLDGVTRRHPH